MKKFPRKISSKPKKFRFINALIRKGENLLNYINYYNLVNILPHMHACMRTRICMHTHLSNKMIIQVNLMKRQTDPLKSKQKSKNKAKMPIKNLAANFPY